MQLKYSIVFSWRCLVQHLTSTAAASLTWPDSGGNYGSLCRRSEGYRLLCPSTAVDHTSPNTDCALPVFLPADESAHLADCFQMWMAILSDTTWHFDYFNLFTAYLIHAALLTVTDSTLQHQWRHLHSHPVDTQCKKSKVLSRALRPMGRRWSPFH